jgi:hypothetical protein
LAQSVEWVAENYHIWVKIEDARWEIVHGSWRKRGGADRKKAITRLLQYKEDHLERLQNLPTIEGAEKYINMLLNVKPWRTTM